MRHHTRKSMPLMMTLKTGRRLFFLGGLASLLMACDGPVKPAQAPFGDSRPPSTKPESVAVSHVARAAFSEMSLVERAMKPLLGLEPTMNLPAGCRLKKSSKNALWEYHWSCKISGLSVGRKEIEGIEKIDFNSEKRILTYEAKFTSKIFRDDEPPLEAYTQSSGRRLKIVFDKKAATFFERGRLTMLSASTHKPTKSSARGSDWQLKVEGLLLLQNDKWWLDKDASVKMAGAVFGFDDSSDRFTMWASGDFNFISRSKTLIAGLADSKCTVLQGSSWDASAVGAGEKFDSEVQLSGEGVTEAGSATLAWPYNLCDRP